MHVDEVDRVLGESSVNRRLEAPAVPAAIRLADERTLGHRRREKLARDQRPGAGHNQGALTFRDKGRIQLSQDPFRAPNATRPHRSKRKRHT